MSSENGKAPAKAEALGVVDVDPITVPASVFPSTEQAAPALATARALADVGVPIFLAQPDLDGAGNWRPAGGHNRTGYWLPSGWQHTEARPDVIDQWRPGTAVCAVMGHGLDALDVDPRNGGQESQAELLAAGVWPSVQAVAPTPSGGRHELVASLGVRSRDGLRPGLDVKAGTPQGGRGFIFLAPTMKASKVTGELVEYGVLTGIPGSTPADWIRGQGEASGTALADLMNSQLEGQAEPEGVGYAELDDATRKRVDAWMVAALDGIAGDLQAARSWPEGFRDERGRGWEKLSADAAWKLARLARAAWNELDMTEAAQIFHANAPVGGSWTGLDKFRKWRDQARRAQLTGAWPFPEDDTVIPGSIVILDGPREVAQVPAEGGQPRAHEEHQLLIPLGREEPKVTFPTDALPTWAAAMVEATATATQTDRAMAGTTLLGVLAAAAGGCVEVEVRPGWREILALDLAIIAEPGERKSAVLGSLFAPVREAEALLVSAAQGERSEAEALRAIALQTADARKREAAKATGADADKALAAAVDAALAVAALTVPPIPRLMADDVTPEAAATLLADHKRLAIVSAEGGIFETMAGRYSNGIPNLDVFLKGHAGDALRVDRKGSSPEYVERPTLNVCLMVQPAIVEGIGRNVQFRGRGLLARFLYAHPQSKVGSRDPEAPPVPDDIRAAYAQRVTSLVTSLAQWLSDPAILTLTEAAHQRVIELLRGTEAELAEGGELDWLRDWGNKYVGAVARIAGLLHLAEHGEAGATLSIEAETIDAASRLGDYFKAHAEAVFSLLGADPALMDALYLRDRLPILLRKHGATVTRRDIFNGARGRFKKVDDIMPALEVLKGHGYLAEVEDSATRTGAGRKPSPKYLIHPSIC